MSNPEPLNHIRFDGAHAWKSRLFSMSNRHADNPDVSRLVATYDKRHHLMTDDERTGFHAEVMSLDEKLKSNNTGVDNGH